MILLILITAVVIFVFYRKLKKKYRKKVFEQYSCIEGNFVIKGKKDNFLIKKNGNIEFMVKNGKIVASRDLRVDKNFVYYGGVADGISK